jgi:hypothetical protein
VCVCVCVWPEGQVDVGSGRGKGGVARYTKVGFGQLLPKLS